MDYEVTTGSDGNIRINNGTECMKIRMDDMLLPGTSFTISLDSDWFVDLPISEDNGKLYKKYVSKNYSDEHCPPDCACINGKCEPICIESKIL